MRNLMSNFLNKINVFSFLKVDLTANGKIMLKNFLINICGLSGSFTIADRQQRCIEYIKETVGDNKVLVGFDLDTEL